MTTVRDRSKDQEGHGAGGKIDRDDKVSSTIRVIPVISPWESSERPQGAQSEFFADIGVCVCVWVCVCVCVCVLERGKRQRKLWKRKARAVLYPSNRWIKFVNSGYFYLNNKLKVCTYTLCNSNRWKLEFPASVQAMLSLCVASYNFFFKGCNQELLYCNYRKYFVKSNWWPKSLWNMVVSSLYLCIVHRVFSLPFIYTQG